ncbi:MAG: YqjD family protein [Burkholderiaceae bacterium]
MDNTKDKLFTDIKSVLSDAEDLIKAAAATSGERAVELRDKALGNLRRAKDAMQDAQAVVYEKSRAAAQAADDYAHDHPWRTAGMAAAAGFLLGLLVNRR